MPTPDRARRPGAAQWALARFALRDLRGSLRFYGVFIACLVLGVMAIVGVDATARAFRDGLASQGAVLLGGDLAFSRALGASGEKERAFLERRGKVSQITTLRAMARRADAPASNLIEMKAVDSAYPLTGAVKTEPPLGPGRGFFAALAERNGAFGLFADRSLGARLNAKLGDRLEIGAAHFVLAGWLAGEPDSIGAIGFGPRVIVSAAALHASGLIMPGSLGRLSLRLRLAPDKASDAEVVATRKAFMAAFPDSGFEIRTRAAPSPQLSRNVERFAQFLSLIGLTALVCGGVGVGNSIRGLIDRKRKTLAILKALGASGGEAAQFVLFQTLLVAAASALIGAALGLALPGLVGATLGANLPFPLEPHLDGRDAFSGVAFGLLTALAFAAAPLDRARSLPATTLLRETAMRDSGFPGQRAVAVAILSAAALFGFALLVGADRGITAEFGFAVLVSFALLYGVARAIMALARRAPHSRHLSLRLAMANLHRPGALTPSFLISLGLGVTLLTALVGVERNLRAEIGESVPKDSPSFFFFDIQAAQAGAFEAFLRKEAPDGVVAVAPMLRGRIVKVNGVPAEQVKAGDKARWALDGDRGITFSAQIPKGSRLVAGTWWPAQYGGPPLVSLESGVAQGLGVKIGDTITVNVLGRAVTARIANLRKVNWRSFNINFVMVFSPDAFAGAPFTRLMTLSLPERLDPAREAVILADAAKTFPSVASVSLRETLATVDGVLGKLSIAIQSAASLAFVVSALVLSGALAAGQRARIYEAVVLKVLGATRGRLLGALALEFALLGAATAGFGVAAGSLAAAIVAHQLLDLSFTFFPGQALAVALGAVAFALAVGLAGTWRILGEKPGRRLKEE
ncbi:FtsX-like permease family protein [Rhodoblastus acidophilus]|uniref:FtsX-like permease family protein n=1 Tax=Candidatus Rhodoblastus alkanivorans TaxID=2954117 RepID=A0ABS9Z143_9HYPH|nr:FtsX-like permease family protein [Candidatus Rhodoblastus alkanivorans]MCI4678559.1 FtsX-like permease family protein [Candidatus Rhodoblastus alkanivorans]MCI4681353.1 FtsX-like permease family protein [Candidatus Rhodoblastus alkanivorans]MDI4642401.1 FtsX-like permease family protein [Rhodoblastus acidophilus]